MKGNKGIDIGLGPKIIHTNTSWTQHARISGVRWTWKTGLADWLLSAARQRNKLKQCIKKPIRDGSVPKSRWMLTASYSRRKPLRSLQSADHFQVACQDALHAYTVCCGSPEDPGDKCLNSETLGPFCSL